MSFTDAGRSVHVAGAGGAADNSYVSVSIASARAAHLKMMRGVTENR